MTVRSLWNAAADDPVLHLEHHLADIGLALGKAVGQLASPDHRRDDAESSEMSVVSRVSMVAPSRSTVMVPVGNLADFVELVRDQNGRNAVRLELEQQGEKRIAILFVEARRRLVENEELNLLRQRLGDLHQLLLADTQIRNQRQWVFFQADFGEEFACAIFRNVPVNHAKFRRFIAEEDILGNRQEWNQGKFLMNDNDALPLTVGDIAKVLLLAVVDYLTLVAAMRINSAEHLHQGRFACAILAHKSVNFAFAYVEIDIVQRLHTRKSLGDVAHFEDGFHRDPHRYRGGNIACAGIVSFCNLYWAQCPCATENIILGQ